MDETSEILDAYHAATLWDMAQEARLDMVDARGKKLPKGPLMDQMRDSFFTRARVLASLAKLNERERAVLDRLLLRGGAAPTQTLRREVLRAGLVTVTEADQSQSRYHYRGGVPYDRGEYAGDPKRPRSTEFADVLARLTFHGLVFSRTTSLTGSNTVHKLRFHPGTLLFVPQTVRQYLPEAEPIPLATAAWQPEQVQPGDPELLLRDRYLYWDFVRRNEVPLLQNGMVGKRSLRALNGLLLVPDPALEEARTEDETGRLYLLRLLLEKLDLVERRGGQLRLKEADPLAIPPYWTWPQPRQLQICLEAWSGLGTTAGWEIEVGQYSPRPAHARKIVLDVLRGLPAGAWFELDEFFQEVMDRDADFLLANHTYVENYRGSYYYSRSGAAYYSGSTKDLLRKFEVAERRFVQEIVTGFLPQLGLVDRGYAGGQWNAFRLTPSGKTLLAGEDAQLPALEAGKLVVQPSFQVLALGPASLPWLARLDLFAERQQADRGAFAYHLSRDSIYQAQQVGLDVPEVMRFLEETSGIELPQNVRRSLEEWGAHHERIVFRSGVSLLQAADAGLLAQLMADPGTGDHLARALSAEVALVRKGAEKPLIAALVGQGLFPAVSGAEPEAADKSVLVREDGSIQAIHAVPSLHLRGRLDRLAEEVGEGRWQLTEKSVRRAGGSKGKVLRLLEELGKLHRGTLPANLEAQLKAWGGYYGAAAAQALTLLQFRDQDALDELRQQPELQPYLAPFAAGNRALAVVPGDKLAEVQEILARFGVSTREGLAC
jgi:hypothetical protein